MPDVKSMLRKQAQWQSTRKGQSWAAKLRQAEQVRGGLEALMHKRSAAPPMTIRERRCGAPARPQDSYSQRQ